MKDQPADVLPGLFEDLSEAPERFDPFVALRIAALEAQRRDVPLDIRALSDAQLAPVAIRGVSVGPDAIRVDAALAGLTGPLSPLPLSYTELAATDRRRRAGGFGAFLDLFADRMTWLFAGAASKYNLASLLQWVPPAENSILEALRALMGGAAPSLADRLPAGPEQTMRYAGLFAQRTRSALGLQALAEAELGLPVRVQQFHRRWRPIPPADQSRLDGTRGLAVDSVAGSHVPNRAGQVRVVIGPVRYADFRSLAVGQPRLMTLARLIKLYLGPVIAFDIQIILDRQDVPESQLGESAQLGWTGWARSSAATQDSDEVVIDGNLAAGETAQPSAGVEHAA